MSAKVVGPSLKNLNKEEMENIYGTNGENPNSTPLTPTPYISATLSAIGGIVSYNKRCLD